MKSTSTQSSLNSNVTGLSPAISYFNNSSSANLSSPSITDLNTTRLTVGRQTTNWRGMLQTSPTPPTNNSHSPNNYTGASMQTSLLLGQQSQTVGYTQLAMSVHAGSQGSLLENTHALAPVSSEYTTTYIISANASSSSVENVSYAINETGYSPEALSSSMQSTILGETKTGRQVTQSTSLGGTSLIMPPASNTSMNLTLQTIYFGNTSLTFYINVSLSTSTSSLISILNEGNSSEIKNNSTITTAISTTTEGLNTLPYETGSVGSLPTTANTVPVIFTTETSAITHSETMVNNTLQQKSTSAYKNTAALPNIFSTNALITTSLVSNATVSTSSIVYETSQISAKNSTSSNIHPENISSESTVTATPLNGFQSYTSSSVKNKTGFHNDTSQTSSSLWGFSSLSFQKNLSEFNITSSQSSPSAAALNDFSTALINISMSNITVFYNETPSFTSTSILNGSRSEHIVTTPQSNALPISFLSTATEHENNSSLNNTTAHSIIIRSQSNYTVSQSNYTISPSSTVNISMFVGTTSPSPLISTVNVTEFEGSTVVAGNNSAFNTSVFRGTETSQRTVNTSTLKTTTASYNNYTLNITATEGLVSLSGNISILNITIFNRTTSASENNSTINITETYDSSTTSGITIIPILSITKHSSTTPQGNISALNITTTQGSVAGNMSHFNITTIKSPSSASVNISTFNISVIQNSITRSPLTSVISTISTRSAVSSTSRSFNGSTSQIAHVTSENNTETSHPANSSRPIELINTASQSSERKSTTQTSISLSSVSMSGELLTTVSNATSSSVFAVATTNSLSGSTSNLKPPGKNICILMY